MCFRQPRNSVIVTLHNGLDHLLAHLFADALAFGVALLECLLLDIHDVFMRAAKDLGFAGNAGAFELLNAAVAPNDSRRHIHRDCRRD